MKNRYYVIIRGPLGVGKTTIAKELAKYLDAPHVQFDRVLEEHGLDRNDNGFTPADFISANGFAIQDLDLKQNGCIAVFDGCFYFKEQIDNLKQRLHDHEEFAFTLTAPIATCIRRDEGRKRVYGEDAARAVYAKVFAMKHGKEIETAGRKVSEVITEIIKILPHPRSNMHQS